MILAYLSIAWIAGIYLGSLFTPPWLLCFTGLLPLALAMLLKGKRRPLLLTGLCLIALLGGMFRSSADILGTERTTLSLYNGSNTVVLKGMVRDEPEMRRGSAYIRLSAQEVTVNGDRVEVSGGVLVRLRPYPDYQYGDILEITGVLESPQPVGGFDYPAYLAKKGIASVMYYPRVSLLSRGGGPAPLVWLHSARTHLSDAIAAALPEPHASIGQAVLLGKRDGIPDYWNDAMSHTGTMHLLAISGLNLSIVAGMFLAVAVRLLGKRRFLYVWLAMAGVWLYATLAGLTPSVLRAAIMATLFLLAEYLGRQRSVITALTFAAALMVAIEPPVLWSASFQLSFTATAGLILISPLVSYLVSHRTSAPLPETASYSWANVVVDSAAVTLGATLATWPLVAYHFGIVSLVGFPATLLLAAALPFIIVTTALTAFSGLVAPALAWVLGWLAWLPIAYMLGVVHLFNMAPFVSLKSQAFPPWVLLAYYSVSAAIVWFGARWMRTGNPDSWTMTTFGGARRAPTVSARTARIARWAVLPLIVVCVLVWTACLSLPDGKLHVSFLDIGNGDAILVRTPDGHNVLIDGGPDPQALTRELGANLPFWDRQIDLMVLTHPHADHLIGLVEVLRRYRVAQVLETDATSDSVTYSEFERTIIEKGVPRTVAVAGQRIDMGRGAFMEVLHPAPGTENASRTLDDTGIVLRLEWHDIAFLFTADIGQEAERELLGQRAKVKSTILKVAHHGSNSSTCAEFLAVVRPAIAVISVGAENSFGLPHADVMERLKGQVGGRDIYLTSEKGTVEVVTDGHNVWMEAP